MSLVVVGSVAYDSIETPHGQVERVLGGSCTYIGLAASYFTQVKVVAVVGEDFDAAEEDFLVSRGLDLSGLERVPGRTFHWSGVYSPDMNERTTLRTELNVFADFDPKLPEHYRSEPYLMLGNIQPALQRAVRSQMNGVRLSAGDTMNYWIAHQRDELLKTLRSWDFLLINDGEARMLAGESNLRRAARSILELGPHTLIVKRGEHGATLFRRDAHFSLPGYLLDHVVDPTGAGDAFAGGFLGYLAEQGADPASGRLDARLLRNAVVYGSVLGSFCCERFGVERFRTLTRAEIDARYREFKALTQF